MALLRFAELYGATRNTSEGGNTHHKDTYPHKRCQASGRIRVLLDANLYYLRRLALPLTRGTGWPGSPTAPVVWGRTGHASGGNVQSKLPCVAPVAQGIERRFPKPCVAGSNPAGGAVWCRETSETDVSRHRRPGLDQVLPGYACGW